MALHTRLKPIGVRITTGGHAVRRWVRVQHATVRAAVARLRARMTGYRATNRYDSPELEPVTVGPPPWLADADCRDQHGRAILLPPEPHAGRSDEAGSWPSCDGRSE